VSCRSDGPATPFYTPGHLFGAGHACRARSAGVAGPLSRLHSTFRDFNQKEAVARALRPVEVGSCRRTMGGGEMSAAGVSHCSHGSRARAPAVGKARRSRARTQTFDVTSPGHHAQSIPDRKTAPKVAVGLRPPCRVVRCSEGSEHPVGCERHANIRVTPADRWRRLGRSRAATIRRELRNRATRHVCLRWLDAGCWESGLRDTPYVFDPNRTCGTLKDQGPTFVAIRREAPAAARGANTVAPGRVPALALRSLEAGTTRFALCQGCCGERRLCAVVKYR
jgi:hypothetical protein